jgi:hypothetical protein
VRRWNATDARTAGSVPGGAVSSLTVPSRLVIRGSVDNVHWVGPDAQRFRDDWHNTHCPQLLTVVSALRGASQSAQTNAQQQEDTSSH